jgi:hypothetical protein
VYTGSIFEKFCIAVCLLPKQSSEDMKGVPALAEIAAYVASTLVVITVEGVKYYATKEPLMHGNFNKWLGNNAPLPGGAGADLVPSSSKSAANRSDCIYL